MHSLESLASYILHKFKGEVTPMKLQKLLYYIKAWTLVAEKKIIPPSEEFYAWKYGPVNPNLYHNYKHFKSNNMGEVKNSTHLEEDEKELIDFILDSYGCYSAITLSKTTHTENPWINNKDTSGKITDHEFLEFYSQESFSNNFPLNSNKPYFPPKTTSHYAYVFDMDKNDKASEISLESIENYLTLFSEAENQANKFLKILD